MAKNGIDGRLGVLRENQTLIVESGYKAGSEHPFSQPVTGPDESRDLIRRLRHGLAAVLFQKSADLLDCLLCCLGCFPIGDYFDAWIQPGDFG